MLKAQRLTTNLQFVPLLLQRQDRRRGADPSADRSGAHRRWRQQLGTVFLAGLPRVLKPGAEDKVSFSEVRLEDGELNYQDETGQVSAGTIRRQDQSVAGLAARFRAPSPPPAPLNGAASASKAMSVSATFSRCWRSGERSGLPAAAGPGDPIKLVFDGTVVNRSNPMMEGIVCAAPTRQLCCAMRCAGPAWNRPAAAALACFALKARANIVGPSVSPCSPTSISSSTRTSPKAPVCLQRHRAADAASHPRRRQRGRSRLSVGAPAAGERARATGTGNCSISAAACRSVSTAAGCRPPRWRSAVRRSAATAHWRLDQRSGALADQHRRSAGLWRHRHRLVRGGPGGRGRRRRGAAAIRRRQPAGLRQRPDLGVRRITGRGNLSFALEAKGSSPFGLAQSLRNGTATLVGHEGAITGFNVEQLLKRLGRRPLLGRRRYRSGQTPLDTPR
ncbi:MAG: hypothetical protein MZV49_24470 [Rhodopseudomonas palustris]|nr:hypothetical protein [Rhodopseudomonas palustris]